MKVIRNLSIVALALGLSHATFGKSLSIDRFEGEDGQIAVLLSATGETFDVPRAILPRSAQTGDIIEIRRDNPATKALKERTRQVQEQLEQTDPGGDIVIK